MKNAIPYFSNKIKFVFLLLLVSAGSYAQLGFCAGSKGDPLFSENFGNGTTYGPALPAGTTTYPFIAGAPNDGFYTLFYHSSFFQPSWHYSLDHTPDATNGPNGKMLLVNANASTSGDFYKKTVTGLCVNTTFEFSAWLLNLYNPTSNICTSQIPINVRFEIWDSTETVLLGSGNTGNIFGTPTPNWQQFALVFTTVSETSVVLKMKNNGIGGCGNDLAIDDISFSACADLTTISSPSVVGDTYTTCTNPASLTLNAATAGVTPYFYQWQSSPDSTTWTDIAGANNPTYVTPNLSSLTYFRVRAAQDLANLGNSFCSTLSNVFTVSILAPATPAVSNGDQVICSDQPIPALSVTTGAATSVNWYSAATGGTLLLANNTSYTPTAAGVYYAETYNATSTCLGSPRTPVSLTIVPLPDATITGTTAICGGNTAVVSFSGTPNAIVTYADGVTNHTLNLNASGLASFTTPVLTATTTYTLVGVASPALATCSRTKNDAVVITVNNSATASFSSNSPVCQGNSVTINFTGTPNATVSYSAGSANQTVILDAAGNASVVVPNVTATTVYTLNQVTVGGVCTQALSQSISVSAVPLPTASISASPLAICSNQTSTISFTGTPNAIITYKIDSGANQTITLNAAGSASIATPPGLTSNSTYTLVGVALPGPNTCSATVSGVVAITVSSLPTASASASASAVCYGTPAVINFSGTPNATVTYSVTGSGNQTVTLNGSGSASVAIPSVTATIVYALNSVTAAGANGCTKALSQQVSVSAVPLPSATINASAATVCSSQTSTINFTGTPNAIVSYKIDSGANQTITLNASGVASLITAPLSAGTTYQLVSATLGSCSQAVSGSAAIAITPAPTLIYNGDLSYCDGEPVSIALSSALAGTTFSWAVSQNGTTGAVSGTGNQIAQAVTLTGVTSGTVTYTVTPFNNGCAGNPAAITVTIHPLPVPQITDGVICTTSLAPPSSHFYTLNTNLSAASHSFQWFFGGNQIPGASGSTYNATQVGTYTVIATNAAGCVSVPVSAVVGEMAQGESLVIEHSEAFADNPNIVITVVGGGGPFSYQLDDGAFQSSNVFHNVLAGTHTVTVVDAYCTNLTGSVTILNYPKYFTPNGDGFHETWNITGVDDAVIWIFDRYGKLLKQIRPEYELGWDGIYNGQPMPSTDYWFVIDYIDPENGANKTFRAHFSLKR